MRKPNGTRRVPLKQVAIVLFCFGLIGYFGHHAVHGRHGMEAKERLLQRAALLEFESNSLEAQREKLKRDVALLSPSKPHPDMVEEVARDVLGFVKSEDIVVLRPHG